MNALFKSAFLVAISLCSFATSALGTNLVLNGGFDATTHIETYGGISDTIPDSWVDAPPNPQSLTKVNVVPSSLFPAFADPDGGLFYVAFQSPAQVGQGQDCLFQAFNTIAGQVYTFSFSAAITSASNFLQLSPEWDVGGANNVTLVLNKFNDSGTGFTTSSGPVAFTNFSFQLTASKSSTGVFFHGVDSNGALLLDNVSLVPLSGAPEPASLWLIGSGLAILGLSRWTKRQSARARS